ncbi:MAG: hypothetical protein ACOH5I_10080 [Oligoflexus sp.]
MARHSKKAKKKMQKPTDKFFNASFNATDLAQDDPALQALKAHRELELKSDHGSLSRIKTTSSTTMLPIQKTPIQIKDLNYHWQHHATNLIFCLVFVGLGFMLSEIRQIISHDEKISQALLFDKLLGGQQPASLDFQVASVQVNVRRGPGLDFAVIEQLKQGAKLKGVLVDDHWVQIDDERFIYRKALKKLSDAPPVVKQEKYWTQLPKTEVFQSNSENSPKISSFSYGQQVLGHAQGDWFVLDDGGYVKRRELSQASPLLMQDGEAMVARVKVAKAPIRTSPGRDGKTVGVFFEGKIVKVMAIENGWAKLAEEQYLPAKYLEASQSDRLSSSAKLDAKQAQ